MDAWTSPNNWAFVVVTVHLEKDGEPLIMLLDVVEVPKVLSLFIIHEQNLMKEKSHTGLQLATEFAQILKDFGISEKVSVPIQRELKKLTFV
jgi:hypothetical protein